jgi:hypothetical protein
MLLAAKPTFSFDVISKQTRWRAEPASPSRCHLQTNNPPTKVQGHRRRRGERFREVSGSITETGERFRVAAEGFRVIAGYFWEAAERFRVTAEYFSEATESF